MKVVVIGGTGLIGSRVVTRIAEHGHEAVAASPGSGVNTLTIPGPDATIFETTFDDWLKAQG